MNRITARAQRARDRGRVAAGGLLLWLGFVTLLAGIERADGSTAGIGIVLGFVGAPLAFAGFAHLLNLKSERDL